MRSRAAASRWFTALAALVSIVLIASGCSDSHTRSAAASSATDLFSVGDLPYSTGPNGMRPNAPTPAETVTGTDGGRIDRLVSTAIDDVQKFWAQTYPAVFGHPFSAETRLQSWDSNSPAAPQFCGQNGHAYPNAAYCQEDDSIGWDRGVLIPTYQRAFTDIGVLAVMAHEYGHRISNLAAINDSSAPVVNEQRSDCFSGAYLHWVAAGQSPAFTLDSTSGLTEAAATIAASRDIRRTANEHGTAFDRVSAFSLGVHGGAGACRDLNLDAIHARQSKQPAPYDAAGALVPQQFSAAGLSAVVKSLAGYFNPGPAAPQVRAATADCTGSVARQPVTYCPSSNTVLYDSDRLTTIGRVGYSGPAPIPTLMTDGFSAYSLVASRYALAVLHGRGQPTDRPSTAAMAACMTGQWAAATRDVGDFTLGPGDVDAAVSGLLDNGLAASDAESRTLPSGLTRVDAFGSGYLGGPTGCDRYRT